MPMSIFLINYFLLNIDPKTKPTQKISAFWQVCKTKSGHCTEPAGDDDWNSGGDSKKQVLNKIYACFKESGEHSLAENMY